MSKATIYDQTGANRFEVDVSGQEGEWMMGRVIACSIGEELRELLLEFERHTNDQVFTLAESVSNQIDAFNFRIQWPDAPQSPPIGDLFVAANGNICFKVAGDVEESLGTRASRS